MEIAIPTTAVEREIYNAESEDWDKITEVPPALCWECREADCTPWPGEWHESDGEAFPSAYGYECQRKDAYSS